MDRMIAAAKREARWRTRDRGGSLQEHLDTIAIEVGGGTRPTSCDLLWT